MPTWNLDSISPNANPQHSTTPSFKEVMSEQLADQLYHDDLQRLKRDIDRCEDSQIDLSTNQIELSQKFNCGILNSSSSLSESIDDTTNDRLLAEMLQKEFNDEYNDIISHEEQHYAGNSKVSVSLEKYKFLSSSDDDAFNIKKVSDLCDDSEDDSEPDVNVNESLNSSKHRAKSTSKGRQRPGMQEPNKHDREICGRRNTAKLQEFPPEFSTGDCKEFGNICLSNVVYNKLKTHSKTEFSRANRLHEKKEHSTADHAIDSATRLILFKLVNSGILEAVNGIMAVGKESVVVHAQGGLMDEQTLPSDCVVKIYKTTLTEFKNRSVYVKGDHRFSSDLYKKLNPRRLLKLWAAKEKANLERMEKNGVPCPHVILLNKHVLVMSFIGTNGCPALQLKEVDWSNDNPQIAYDQTIEIMRRLHRDCGLVHADLSQYNILWHGGQVHVIDVGQSVELTHPLAFEFLLRDCHNITSYFKNVGVDVKTSEDLFREITELSVEGEGSVFLSNIQTFVKEQDTFRESCDVDNGEYQFDHFFDQTFPTVLTSSPT